MTLIVLLLSTAAGLALYLWLEQPMPVWTPRGREAADPGPTVPEAALVPEVLDLLALALVGGASLGGAVRTVAAVLPDNLGTDLDAVGVALLRGVDTEEAWAQAGELFSPARRCLGVAAEAGVSPGPSLRKAATDLRRETMSRVEIATARLGVRLVLPLGLAFLPAFVLTTVVPLVLALTRDLAW